MLSPYQTLGVKTPPRQALAEMKDPGRMKPNQELA
jgi:hypothetical protein